jgi:hypothetical protein
MLMTTRFTASLCCLLMAAACGTAPQDSKSTPGTAPQAAPSTPGTGSGAAPAPAPTPGASAAPASSGGSNGHEHTAPHGGALVELGEEFAHLEIVLAAATGTLTAYALDGEAEQAVRLAQPSIELVVMKGGGPVQLTLQAVANELTGERAGETSQFTVTSPDLQQVARFEGRIQSINIRGQEFRDVSFRFPEGSEH